MEKRVTSMKKAKKHLNIPLTSLSNNINHKIKFKWINPLSTSKRKENVTIMAKTLSMQKCGLFILALHQLKLKVEKLAFEVEIPPQLVGFMGILITR